MVNSFSDIYRDRRVLVTGHTGFKGGWLSLWLHSLGTRVSGLSLPAPEGLSLFSLLPSGMFESSQLVDMRTPGALHDAIAASHPEIIFHLAAQPIVGASYRDPIGTFTTNALATAMLLEAVRETGSNAAVLVVTSDKCYRNDNSGRPFIETDPLGGHDVYSMSKAAAELVVASWHSSFFATNPALGPLATGRAGNVIGGGDYAEDRIVADAVRAAVNQQPLCLRRPQATRPWQHVLESVSGYLALGERLLVAPDSQKLLNYNFGPDPEAERSVKELVDAWLRAWPNAFALEIASTQAYGEATRLSLDHTKAVRELGWKPVWDFEATVAQTASWYRLRHEQGASNERMLEYTLSQLHTFTRDAQAVGAAWANGSERN